MKQGWIIKRFRVNRFVRDGDLTNGWFDYTSKVYAAHIFAKKERAQAAISAWEARFAFHRRFVIRAIQIEE